MACLALQDLGFITGWVLGRYGTDKGGSECTELCFYIGERNEGHLLIKQHICMTWHYCILVTRCRFRKSPKFFTIWTLYYARRKIKKCHRSMPRQLFRPLYQEVFRRYTRSGSRSLFDSPRPSTANQSATQHRGFCQGFLVLGFRVSCQSISWGTKG